MKNQVCTIEQMNALKELGVDISKASMFLYREDEWSLEEVYVTHGQFPPKGAILTLTVADILDMLPESIKDNYNRINYYFDLLVLKSNRRYSCIYVNKHLKQTIYSSGDYLLLRDALFDILVQLAKDGKL
jgi:hypothetical protein